MAPVHQFYWFWAEHHANLHFVYPYDFHFPSLLRVAVQVLEKHLPQYQLRTSAMMMPEKVFILGFENHSTTFCIGRHR